MSSSEVKDQRILQVLLTLRIKELQNRKERVEYLLQSYNKELNENIDKVLEFDHRIVGIMSQFCLEQYQKKPEEIATNLQQSIELMNEFYNYMKTFYPPQIINRIENLEDNDELYEFERHLLPLWDTYHKLQQLDKDFKHAKNRQIIYTDELKNIQTQLNETLPLALAMSRQNMQL